MSCVSVCLVCRVRLRTATLPYPRPNPSTPSHPSLKHPLDDGHGGLLQGEIPLIRARKAHPCAVEDLPGPRPPGRRLATPLERRGAEARL